MKYNPKYNMIDVVNDVRYKPAWYDKRLRQTRAMKIFLISKILQHEPAIRWDADELQWLNYEDLLELAIAAVNKDINITLGKGQDYDNDFDAKAVIARLHGGGISYGANVRCEHKKACYVLLYENYHNKFYFFAIPTEDCFNVNLSFSLSGHPKRKLKWWQYECATFEEMATTTMRNLTPYIPKGIEYLITYKEQYGDCRVPQKHKTSDGYLLGDWVSRQRQSFNKKTLTEEKIKILDDLGFIWDANEEYFKRAIEYLSTYREQYGDCRVNVSHKTSDGFKLGVWVSRQRTSFKNKTLTEDKINILDALGFIWDAAKEDFATIKEAA